MYSDRIQRSDMLMGMAFLAAMRSTCGRLKVGAILEKDGRVVSMGYAGPPAGEEHCSPEICDLSKPCLRTIHAEANAIAYSARSGVGVMYSSLYSTHSPCVQCSRLIINSGIKKVYYSIQYRDLTGIRELVRANVEVEHWLLPEKLKVLSQEIQIATGAPSGSRHNPFA